MKKKPAPRRPVGLAALPPSSQLATLGAWMDFAADVYARAGRPRGHITAAAHHPARNRFHRTHDCSRDPGPDDGRQACGCETEPDRPLRANGLCGPANLCQFPAA